MATREDLPQQDDGSLWDPWVDGGRPVSGRRRSWFNQKLFFILLTPLFLLLAGILLGWLTQPIPEAPVAVAPVTVPAPSRPAGFDLYLKATLRGLHAGVSALAFSPDGKTLASASGQWNQPHVITLWDVAEWKERFILAGHSNNVDRLVFSPDGKAIASAGDDGVVKLWSVERGEEEALFPGSRDRSSCAAFSPDGRTLAFGVGDRRDEGPGTIRLWDLAERRERGQINALRRAPTWLDFSPDGTTIASAGGLVMADLWDAATGAHKVTLRGHYLEVMRVNFSPDGMILATSGQDGHVRLWEAATGRTLADWPYVLNPSFAPAGKLVAVNASTTAGYSIQLRDVHSGKVRATIPESAGELAFSPDGSLLASAPPISTSEATVHVWDVRRLLQTTPDRSERTPE